MTIIKITILYGVALSMMGISAYMIIYAKKALSGAIERRIEITKAIEEYRKSLAECASKREER